MNLMSIYCAAVHLIFDRFNWNFVTLVFTSALTNVLVNVGVFTHFCLWVMSH